jgi:hypothetical protein
MFKHGALHVTGSQHCILPNPAAATATTIWQHQLWWWLTGEFVSTVLLLLLLLLLLLMIWMVMTMIHTESCKQFIMLGASSRCSHGPGCLTQTKFQGILQDQLLT